MRETSNYKLNQWDKTDRIQMEDFNSDNEKTDAALKTLAGQLAANREETNAALATKGNCRIEQRTYVGTGTYGKDAPNSMTFAEKPLLMVLLSSNEYLVFYGGTGGTMSNKGFGFYVNWSENTFSWYSDTADHQYNYKNRTYTMIAFYAAA